MCGIAGIYNLNARPLDQSALARMTDMIRHRGPDDAGYALFQTQTGKALAACGQDTISELQALHPQLPCDFPANLGFGFRRLSILDLSPAGHQPMFNADGSLCIVFNGEIYNYLELKAELQTQGCAFHTQTDTEVILCAYRTWGADCLSRFIGMWAFAIYDLTAGTLFCARDRYGIKPFYYSLHQSVLVFGSEIKQLLAAGIDKELNRQMIYRSMKINSLLAYGSETYFKHIHSLQPGHYLLLKDGKHQIKCYDHWDISAFESSRLSFPEAVEHYRELFLDSVKLQMRSDVEVGSCLSGGMDSSAIVCTAAQLTGKPFQTFSSYYAEDRTLDERQWIEHVTHNTRSVSHLISPVCNKTIDWFATATWHNDLPVGAGFVSQYAVMQLARQHGVKVLLDGQGSDELTAGYNHAFYRYFADLLRHGKLRKLDVQLHRYFAGKPLNAVLSTVPRIMLSALLNEHQLYNLELNHYRFEPFDAGFGSKVHGNLKHRGFLLSEIKALPTSRLSNFLYNMMHSTSIQTLLHYEDRMSMAHGVESRVPFLDHRLVQFAFTLPSSYKVHPPYGKYVHREAMKDIIPRAIYDRKDKAIFSSPFYSVWLKEKLKGYVDDLFTSVEFRQRGIYNLPLIEKKWHAYRDSDTLSKRNKADAEMLFNLLALETWFRVILDSDKS